MRAKFILRSFCDCSPHLFTTLLACDAVPYAVASKHNELVVLLPRSLSHLRVDCHHLFFVVFCSVGLVFKVPHRAGQIETPIDSIILDKPSSSLYPCLLGLVVGFMVEWKRYYLVSTARPREYSSWVSSICTVYICFSYEHNSRRAPSEICNIFVSTCELEWVLLPTWSLYFL